MIVPTRTQSNASSMARPTSMATEFSSNHRSLGRSVHLSTWSTGTTSTWPAVIGAIVRNATTRSSLQTKRPGRSPRMMRVNTESGALGALSVM